MSASIIVPVYNALDYARRCVESLYAVRCETPFEVIVVDNGSAGDVRRWLEEEQAQRPTLRALHFDEPLGFARAVNQGARVARYEHLVVLNSDTVATDGWLDALTGTLDADPAIGVASPVTNNCGHEVQADADAAGLDVSDAAAYAERIRDRREILFDPQRLVFFCVMIRRSLWEQLAGLDEGYLRGNFEDDDFCLRARLLGYRLAVVRHGFVYHHERKTFESNQLAHAEWLARNQTLFCTRASRWSRSVFPSGAGGSACPDLSVIVPVAADRAPALDDSLASLVNQTVAGFEVIVVSSGDVSPALDRYSNRLRLTSIRLPGARLATLLNAGLDAAQGTRAAFLPAGDLYFPFHLEVLLDAVPDAGAAYSAWAFLAGDRAGAVRFDQAAPDHLLLGDWAPLVCWICSAPVARFDESFGGLTGWEFALRLSRAATPCYVRRLTCRKLVTTPPDIAEARCILEQYPVEGAWHQEERRQFLRGVESGAWEAAMIFGRADIERRARRLLAPPEPLTPDPKELEALTARLRGATERVEPPETTASTVPDVLLFNIVGWTHLIQRPHHFARGLARRGHRVFWIDVQLQPPALADSAMLARRLEPNLFYVELPAAKGELYLLRWAPAVVDAMEAAIGFLQRAHGIDRAVQLVNFPKWMPLVDRLRSAFGWPVVYDCLDNQQAFGELHRHNDPQFEEALVREASLVVTSGRTLFEAQRGRNPNTLLIQNAADFDLFAHAAPAGLLANLPRPVIGFFGAFSEWLDRGWIAEAARRYPGWSFVYIGRDGFARGPSRRDWGAATAAPNVTVWPQVDLPELAQYLAGFDVCIMPFRDLPITRSMNPVKIFEYLAAGKPVVVPDLPETRPLADEGLIAVYRDWPESFELLEDAVREGNRDDRIRVRRAFAAENAWPRRVDELASALRRVCGGG